MRLFVPGRQALFCTLKNLNTIEGENFTMKKMTSGELRSMWLNFFKSKGHAVIPSASVIPENDPFCSPPRACIRSFRICWAASIRPARA